MSSIETIPLVNTFCTILLLDLFTIYLKVKDRVYVFQLRYISYGYTDNELARSSGGLVEIQYPFAQTFPTGQGGIPLPHCCV